MNILIFVVLCAGLGIFCLIFTKQATQLFSAFVHLGSILNGHKVQKKQTLARPLFIRLVGIVQLSLAVIVYLTKVVN